MPENCVYALVLPPQYVATQLSVEPEGYRYPPNVEVAVSPEQRIFHYVVLMGERRTLQIKTRLSFDEEQHQHVLKSVETVTATSKYADLRNNLRNGALSSDFWFKLLDLGSKWNGGS